MRRELHVGARVAGPEVVNPSATCSREHAVVADDQAVPRFHGYGVPLGVRFRIGSIAHTEARYGLRA
jgi:hypothetical protein